MSGQDDSATVFENDDIDIGDLVFDRDTNHSEPAVVVNIPPKTADEWTAYTNTTVAEDNPEYPDDASIIVVAFRNEILDEQPEMVAPDSPIPLQDLNEVGIKHYSFPAPRLRHADPETDDFEDFEAPDNSDDIDSDGTEDASTPASEDKETETSETIDDQEQDQEQDLQHELEQLSDFLHDNGVRSETEDGMVVAKKLGQSYEITLDGEVNGDGPYQDRLEQLATEYTS